MMQADALRGAPVCGAPRGPFGLQELVLTREGPGASRSTERARKTAPKTSQHEIGLMTARSLRPRDPVKLRSGYPELSGTGRGLVRNRTGRGRWSFEQTGDVGLHSALGHVEAGGDLIGGAAAISTSTSRSSVSTSGRGSGPSCSSAAWARRGRGGAGLRTGPSPLRRRRRRRIAFSRSTGRAS